MRTAWSAMSGCSCLTNAREYAPNAEAVLSDAAAAEDGDAADGTAVDAAAAAAAAESSSREDGPPFDCTWRMEYI